MNLRRGDERSCARAAYDHTLALQSGERLAGGHEANSVNPRQFPFRVDNVTGLQLTRLESCDDRALNPLVRGHSVLMSLLHENSLRECTILQSALALQTQNGVRSALRTRIPEGVDCGSMPAPRRQSGRPARSDLS